jgi:uncharacterized protein
LYAVRRGVRWIRLWPFLVGGVLGVPIGVAALSIADPDALKPFLGALLVAYSSVMLGVRRFPIVIWGGRMADGMVGFGGGALGGLVGLSGPLAIIWCGLKGWTSEEQRGVYQPFNLIILAFVFVGYASQGVFTNEVWWFAAAGIPATLLGAFLGIRVYGRLNEEQVRRIILCLLLASGMTLVASTLL